MAELIRQYLAYLFGETNPVYRSPRNRRRLQRQRRIIAITLMQYISMVAVLLLAVSAIAQESQPKYRFDRPSDEMDFTLPPVPSLPGEEAVPALDGPQDLYGFESDGPDDDDAIDQFFSTTTIIAPQDQQEPEFPEIGSEAQQLNMEDVKPDPVPVVKKTYTPRVKSAFTSYAKPKHRFKSVNLPQPLYCESYGRENKHLPPAYTMQVQQGLFERAIMRNDINAMRALHSNGAAIDSVTADGTPYVTLATRYLSADALRFLLMYGADAREVDANGADALDYALQSNNPVIVQLLQQYSS